MTIEHRELEERGRTRDTGKLAAQLAPLEEVDKLAAQKQGVNDVQDESFGVIRVETPKLPESSSHPSKGPLGIEPVVLTIAVILLVFIAFITWQISLMPATPQP